MKYASKKSLSPKFGLVQRTMTINLVLLLWSGIAPAHSSAQPSSDETPRSLKLSDSQSKVLLTQCVEEADLIPELGARLQAQWNLVQVLLKHGMKDAAFEQALKLRTSNPQTCIYSLKTIAMDALSSKDQATVQRVWDTAIQVNREAKQNFNHYVIELGFQMNRSADELIELAKNSKNNDQLNAYRDIRNEFAWRGRIPEATAITAKYLGRVSREMNDLEVAYYCSNARHYDYNLKHDNFGQAIQIIERMPKGKNRDVAISQLIDGLFYVANQESVSNERLRIAETWANQIDDPAKKSVELAKVLAQRTGELSVEALEEQLAQLTSREEKETIFRKMFDLLIREQRIDEADKLLDRRLQLIREQPRPETISKFGNFSDDDAIMVTTWTHHQAIVTALQKAGRVDEARARLESIKTLKETGPKMMIGNLADIRLTLAMQLGEMDEAETMVREKHDPVATVGLAVWIMGRGEFDRGWKHVEPLLDLPPEAFFPSKDPGVYFRAAPIAGLAKVLLQSNHADAAFQFLSKLPENRESAQSFEEFGKTLAMHCQPDELDAWLARLPLHMARVHVRLGVLRAWDGNP